MITYNNILLLCSKMCKYVTTNTDSIIAGVSILLGFISVILSYFAIKATHKVHKEVGLQQYKIKQQEVVAQLIERINNYEFCVCLKECKEGNVKLVSVYCVNLLGLLNLNNELQDKYPQFCSGSFGISQSEYLGFYQNDAYIPPSIAKSLQLLGRDVWSNKEIKIDKAGITIDHYPETNADYYTLPIHRYDSWKSFVKIVDNVISSINDWFKENNFAEPNILSYLEHIPITK